MRCPKLTLFHLFLCFFFAAAPAWAEDAASAESAPQLSVENPPSSPTAGAYGEILFFPGAESRPSDERHQVQAGQKIEFCIRLSPGASQFVERMVQKAIGFQLLMEDASVPPRRLSIVVGNRLFRLKPDRTACFGGEWKIPQNAAPAAYQVADLLWAAADQSYYSLRHYLYEFSRVEELEVRNDKYDSEAPRLLGLHHYKKPPYNMAYEGGVLRIRLEQAFKIVDEGSGIDKKSLRVFYRLGVGGDRSALEEAKCRRVQQTDRFRCLVQAAAPDFFWNAEPVSLSLESLSVKDEAGNELRIEGAEAFRSLIPKANLVFDFQRKRQWKSRPDRNLNREPPLPLEGLQADPELPESLPQSG